jgi:hypothetical protein
MLRKQRKGWIAAVVLVLLLSASAPAAASGPDRGTDGSWIVRLLGWLGLPPTAIPLWSSNSSGTDDSIHIDPDGQPGSAGTDDSIYIDPNG